MPAARLKSDLEALLGSRFDTPVGIREAVESERLSSSVPEFDRAFAGLPRGALTELFGAPSAGRTSLTLSLLAEAAARQEVCAWLDTSNAFDPASASAAGIDLDRLLWVRCSGRPEHALQAADLIVHAGGFGLIVLDIAGVPPKIARHIPLVSWFRLRRAVENTPAVLLLLSDEPQSKSAASLLVEMARQSAEWSGAPGVSQLLRGARIGAQLRKPPQPARARWDVRAIG